MRHIINHLCAKSEVGNTDALIMRVGETHHVWPLVTGRDEAIHLGAKFGDVPRIGAAGNEARNDDAAAGMLSHR